MNLAHVVGCSLFVAQALLGQTVVALADRQEILVEGHVMRRTAAEPALVMVPDLPDIRPSLRPLERMELAWDGSKVYQVGFTEDLHRVVCVGMPYFTSSGERRWLWTEPKTLPLLGTDSYTFLGAFEDSLLFLQIHRETKPKPELATSQKASASFQNLLRIDLMTGVSTRLIDVETENDFRNTVLFSKGAFYLFTAAGKAIRVGVHTEPWGVDRLSSNYWSETRVTLCKDTGEFQNPFLFGKAFLDLDGSILLPTQVFLPLNREDIDLAWSKLPQSRKAELISSGLWPVPVGKEIGWKDDVCFLKFDPNSATFGQADRLRFEHLVVEEDKHFMTRRFRVFEPTLVFTSNGGKILPLEEALRITEAGPVSAPKGKNAAKNVPVAAPSPVVSTKGK